MRWQCGFVMHVSSGRLRGSSCRQLVRVFVADVERVLAVGEDRRRTDSADWRFFVFGSVLRHLAVDSKGRHERRSTESTANEWAALPPQLQNGGENVRNHTTTMLHSKRLTEYPVSCAKHSPSPKDLVR